MGIAIGIDLGTTNSCVAVVQGNQAKIIEDVAGHRIHPSVISFHPNGETLVGHTARDRLVIDPANTIYSFKRLIGRDLGTQEMQELIASFPFEVIDKNRIPVLKTRQRETTLPEVSAIMLKSLRSMCKETYGIDINECIITVPANFTDVQRASTKIAGRIAGFNVLRILNEPTAAALAYGFGAEREERIAIYDFGGGTFDITIISLMGDVFEVLATAGDTFLGGDDFDAKIVKDMLMQFKKEHGFDPSDDPVAMQRLRSVAERAKCQLSTINEVQATLRELARDKKGQLIDFSFSMTRERFDQLIHSLIERSLATCEEALSIAKLSVHDLDNIVMVGGTTRIPRIRQEVESFFKKKPRTEINPDEVVAIGAAINAFSLTGEPLPEHLKPATRQSTVDPFSRRSLKPDVTPPAAVSERAVSPFRSAPKIAPASAASLPAADDPFADLPAPKEAKLDAPFAEDSAPIFSDPFAEKRHAPPAPPLKKDTPPTTSPSPEEDDTWGDLPAPMPPPPKASDDPFGLDSDLPIPVPRDPAADDFDAGLRPTATHAPAETHTEEITDLEEFEEIEEIEEITDDGDALDAPSHGAFDDFGSLDFPVAPPATERASATTPDSMQGLPPVLRADPMPTAAALEPDLLKPLDQVVGEDGKEAVPEQHEAFVVPIKQTAPAVLLDVTPRALGVATAGGYCDIIIERNAAIPIEQSRTFTTSRNDQTEVTIEVYQGESRKTEENTLLGKIYLTDIRPALRGEITIRVTFEIDTDGILNVDAVNEESGMAQSTSIQISGGLDEAQIDSLVKKYSDNDE